VKPDRCQATAASGKPCSASPRPGRPFCLWHDDEAVAERQAISRKGGAARSNSVRARRKFASSALGSDQVLGLLSVALRDVIDGKLEPGIANAAANLGRAIVAVREATEVEARIAALEVAAGIGDGRSA